MPKFSTLSSVVALIAFAATPIFAAETPPSEAAPSTAATPGRADPENPAPSQANSPPHAVVAGVPIRFAGILHSMVELTEGVQSFDVPTAVAPTSAMNPVLVAEPDRPLLSMQVQQTRLGMVLGEGTSVRGQVEIDFVHFDQSSPTVQAYPRIRIMELDWTFADNHRLFVGQGWDLFGNATLPQLLSHSANLVGTLFRAGNVGFMRHQLGYSGRFGDVEFAAAVGLPGSNAGPSIGALEQGLVPTGSGRVMFHLGSHGVVGGSGLVTALRFAPPDEAAEYRTATGGELFADLTFGPVNVHAEAYVAMNLAGAGALSLGAGRHGTDVTDAGGYLSAKFTTGIHAVTLMLGSAAVLNADDVLPAYLPASADTPSAVATLVPANGPGITSNATLHAGYWLTPFRGLSFVLEPYLYRTGFRLTEEDLVTEEPMQESFGCMFATLYQF